MGQCFVGLAGVAAVTGQAERAARLFGAADGLLQNISNQLEPVDRAAYAYALAIVQSQLDDAVFQTAWAAGRSLSQEQVLAEARLLVPLADAPPARSTSQPSSTFV